MASITAFTGNVPQNYDTYLGPLFFEPYAVDLAERVPNSSCDSILELASGTGRLTKHLLNKLKPGGKITATDLNEAMLAVASSKLKDSRITWQPVDAQELPFENEAFDLVACQYGVMFFHDKLKAFTETARVLKKGSLFLFNTWDELRHNELSYLAQEVLVELFPGDPPDFMAKGPFSFYNKEEIQQLLINAGFDGITIETVRITSTAASAEDCANGLVGGTPISGYLKEKNMPEETVKEKIIRRLHDKYGQTNLQLPMQAFVCSAIKK